MNETDFLLNAVYNRTQKASMTLGALLSDVENKSLRRDIIAQICEYDKINKSAGEEICSNGNKPRKRLPLSDRVSIWSLSMTPSQSYDDIAKIISKESSNGITNIVKAMNSCVNSSPTAYNLARTLVSKEESNVEKMKPYL